VADHLRRPVVLYDTGCRFCRWAGRLAVRVDRRGRLAFLSLEDEEAAALLATVPESERSTTWWLVERDGSLRSRGRAAAALAGHMTGLGDPGPLRGRLGAVLDHLYEAVARRRSLLGRLVPNGPGPGRYP
jgi:predicted DCC family thiol-disulfide oxidoreductase YuxK